MILIPDGKEIKVWQYPSNGTALLRRHQAIKESNKKEPAMKTQTQIIDETVEFYSADPKRRALNSKGMCEYITPDGRMCALGRCAAHPASLDGSQYAFSTIQIYGDSEVFKPEYQGHPASFWNDLQKLHDTEAYWDSEGITAAGLAYVAVLKDNVPDEESPPQV